MQRLGATDQLRDIEALQGAVCQVRGDFAVERIDDVIERVAGSRAGDLEAAGAAQLVKAGQRAQQARHADAAAIHDKVHGGRRALRIDVHLAVPVAAKGLELRQVGGELAIVERGRERRIGQFHIADRESAGLDLDIGIDGLETGEVQWLLAPAGIGRSGFLGRVAFAEEGREIEGAHIEVAGDFRPLAREVDACRALARNIVERKRQAGQVQLLEAALDGAVDLEAFKRLAGCHLYVSRLEQRAKLVAGGIDLTVDAAVTAKADCTHVAGVQQRAGMCDIEVCKVQGIDRAFDAALDLDALHRITGRDLDPHLCSEITSLRQDGGQLSVDRDHLTERHRAGIACIDQLALDGEGFKFDLRCFKRA